MKLLTKEVENKFREFPYLSQDGKGFEAEVLVRYFNPCGAGDWIIIEADETDNDWILFGYCSIGYGYELGSVSFNELQSIRLPYGLRIERDLHLEEHTKVSDLITRDDLM